MFFVTLQQITLDMKKNLLLNLIALLCWSSLTYAENWMSRLPDDAYVAVVSIPGAHDAATGCGWDEDSEELGDNFAKTQDLDLKALWSAGVRAFDLRPCVYEEYMNINHGIIPTKMHFEDALCMLRDSLVANPSEFVVIHLLHERDGDRVEDVYNTRLLELLKRDDLKEFLMDFKTDLKVSDMRGKMLILSRDNYSNAPVGGVMKNWTGEINWTKQTAGRIVGPRAATGFLYMQDYSDTHEAGGVDRKIAGINQMLDFSTTHETTTKPTIRWILNFASAYSKVMNLFGTAISTSEGYRDNASHTHAAFLDYFSTHEAGPTGIVLMDFAGVDTSEGYEVKGLQLVKAIIDNNYKYLKDGSNAILPILDTQNICHFYSLAGVSYTTPHKGLNIARLTNGTVRKVIYKD